MPTRIHVILNNKVESAKSSNYEYNGYLDTTDKEQEQPMALKKASAEAYGVPLMEQMMQLLM